ncbi:MAG: alpha/beta hydrolase, partial [Acidimicrobiales bacterium]
RIAVPTTVVVGTLDVVTPIWSAKDIAAGIPGARLVTIAGAGHMLPLEAIDQVSDLIAAPHSNSTQ